MSNQFNPHVLMVKCPISSLGRGDECILLGFGLCGDLARLRDLCGHVEPKTCIDLQEDLRSGGGLSDLIAQHLGRELLKEQQCSDWSCRPWSPEQLRYAALDAHALLSLLASKLEATPSSHQELSRCFLKHQELLYDAAKPRFVALGPEAVDDALRALQLPIREVVGAVPAGVMHCKTLGLVTTGSIKEDEKQLLAVAVLSVGSQLSLTKTAKALGWSQVRLAKRRDLPALFGFEVGGMGPLGLRTACPLLLDETMSEAEELLVGGGAPNRDVFVPQAVLLEALGGRHAALAEEPKKNGERDCKMTGGRVIHGDCV